MPYVRTKPTFNLKKSLKVDNMGILSAIGKTPVIQMSKTSEMFDIQLYAKLEMLNPGGSMKDRTSLSILSKAMRDKEISKDSTIVESSSGNMAVGLAQFCLYHKLKLVIVVDPFALKANVELMRIYGAEVVTINEPCPIEGWLGARINYIKDILDHNPRAFWPNQYANPMNPSAHKRTMREFDMAMPARLDYLFISTSTCGTLMGCHEYIKERDLHTKLVVVDAEGSVLFGNPSGPRLIPGHGASRPSQLLDRSVVHDVIHVDDLECVRGCRDLLNSEAILAGGSSGGVYSAIRKYVHKIPEQSVCGMLICDRGERYMDTIYNKVWVEENLALVC